MLSAWAARRASSAMASAIRAGRAAWFRISSFRWLPILADDHGAGQVPGRMPAGRTCGLGPPGFGAGRVQRIDQGGHAARGR